MNNLLQIAALFLAELAFGSAIVIPFFPIKTIGKSYLRFYFGFIALLLGLFLWALFRLDQFHTNYAVLSGVALWIWILSFRQSFLRIEFGLIWFFVVCSLAMLFLYPLQYVFAPESLSLYFFDYAMLIVAAVFLSFNLMNMIFGHWYLMNPDLPIEHLIKTCRALVFICYARVLTVGLSLGYAYKQMSASEFERLIDFMGHGVFFWARVLAGLALPLLVAHLAYESAKIKSNQSATGILYAGCIFVLMGELMALYLFGITGYFF